MRHGGNSVLQIDLFRTSQLSIRVGAVAGCPPRSSFLTEWVPQPSIPSCLQSCTWASGDHVAPSIPYLRAARADKLGAAQCYCLLRGLESGNRGPPTPRAGRNRENAHPSSPPCSTPNGGSVSTRLSICSSDHSTSFVLRVSSPIHGRSNTL